MSDGLRGDGREVWLGGERVQDVTGHPAFRGSLEGIAGFFDWQHRHAGDCIIADPVLKRATGISHLIPRSADDLGRRHRGLERLARYSMGMLGRTPDYVNLTFAGFAGQPSLWSANGNEEDAENLAAFQREVAEKDLALTHTIIHPTVDGRIAPYEGINGGVALKKVSESGGGIVVRGARILATLGPFADELAVYPGQPIPKDARDVALVFSIPLATPGLKMVCRDHYGLDAEAFDQSFSSHFDEKDAFVVFDDVEIPRHRVFLDGDPETYNAVMARGWTGNVMQQTCIRAMVKLEFAYELCCRMAETLGTNRRPEAIQMLGEIWSYAVLIRAAEADAHDFGDGAWFCDEAPFRALRPILPGWMPRVNEIIKLTGSHNLLATPAKAGLEHPELRPWLERYLSGAGEGDAGERSRLFRTAWDFVGSALGARTELYERYYLASAARTYVLAHIAAQKDREWDQVPAFWAASPMGEIVSAAVVGHVPTVMLGGGRAAQAGRQRAGYHPGRGLPASQGPLRGQGSGYLGGLRHPLVNHHRVCRRRRPAPSRPLHIRGAAPGDPRAALRLCRRARACRGDQQRGEGTAHQGDQRHHADAAPPTLPHHQLRPPHAPRGGSPLGRCLPDRGARRPSGLRRGDRRCGRAHARPRRPARERRALASLLAAAQPARPQDYDPSHVVTPEARAADLHVLACWERGDHAAVCDFHPEYCRHAPEGRFAHYLMQLGAIGGRACKARGERYSAYENALGTGQVHVVFDLDSTSAAQPEEAAR